jgi:hypothetical protein
MLRPLINLEDGRRHRPLKAMTELLKTEKRKKERKKPVSLSLDSLRQGHGAITPSYGGVLAECAAVALESQAHQHDVKLSVAGAYRAGLNVSWQPTTLQMRQCHADEQVATEHGAYGVAVLVLRELTGLSVVSRSRKGTGFDFWVGEPNGSGLPFQDSGRMEVSGIRRGNKTTVRSRLRQKMLQTRRSEKTSLTAWAFVVEFGKPVCQVAKS